MARRPATQPTEGELEILRVLWSAQSMELGEIRAAMQPRRSVASSTVATMLDVMKRKGLVERETGPRGYRWFARVSRDQTAAGLVKRLIDHVFDGSARSLMSHLIERQPLAQRDREEMQRLLSEGSKKNAPTRRGRKKAT